VKRSNRNVGLQEIEWVILGGFCLPAKGLDRDGVERSWLGVPAGDWPLRQ